MLDGSFQKINGSEIISIIKNVDSIVNFLKEHIVPSITFNAICDGWKLWKDISRIMTITNFDNENDFNVNFTSFKSKLNKFYAVGKISFLTKDPSHPGKDETFYMHCLRFYLPKRMEMLYRTYGVGLGICTMQGFERRNKESKNVMRRFFNGKGNIIKTNLKTLWMFFKYAKNNY